MRKILTVVTALLLLTLAFAVPASSAPAPLAGGSVRVTISAPEGVAANVALTGASTQIAAKPPTGTRTTVTAPARQAPTA